MKLTRRRLLVACVVAAAVGGGAWLAVAEREPSQPPFGVTRAAYLAIRSGMTIEEVERMVGQPAVPSAGVFDTLDYPFEREGDGSLCSQGGDLRGRLWSGDGAFLWVSINPDGVICERVFCTLPVLDKILGQVQDFGRKLGF